jgi:glycosyltransferase involved in cell wall biosynthesis
VKICIDATPIGNRTTDKGGVYRYIWKLVESLSRIDRKNRYTLFFNFFRNEHYPVFRETVGQLKVGDNFKVKLSRFPTELQRYIAIPAEVLSGKFDVFHGCFDFLRPILIGRGVVTIHDIRYLENMEYETDPGWIKILRQTPSLPTFYIRDCLSRDNLFRHLRTTIKQTVKRADMIITVSEFSKERITEKLGVPDEKIKVIYPGVNAEFSPQAEERVEKVKDKFRINKRYILYVGKFEPQKNIIRLLEAFQKVSRREDVVLVMAGPFNWYYHIIREKVGELDISDKVVFTDFVTDEEMSALYSGASVFFFPSLYEGFGMPILEAMACGTPVVTSPVCSIPEVASDAAIFADPSSPEKMADAIISCMNVQALRDDLISKGRKRAEYFSWNETASKTLEAYEGLC